MTWYEYCNTRFDLRKVSTSESRIKSWRWVILQDSIENSHILVIDDDRSILELLSSSLSLEGYTVSLCHDSSEAVERVETERPDLIILDVKMPKKSGIDVMLEIRSKPIIKEIPILFLSAVGEESIKVEGLKGADDYVVKPFKMLEFQERIRKILKRSRSQEDMISSGGDLAGRLAVRTGNATFLVPYEEIYFIEASGKYTYVHKKNKRLLSGYSIGELEEKLGRSGVFLRIHRSSIINVDHVHKITRDAGNNMQVVMNDDGQSELRVSESYLPGVRKKLGV